MIKSAIYNKKIIIPKFYASTNVSSKYIGQKKGELENCNHIKLSLTDTHTCSSKQRIYKNIENRIKK